MIRWVIDQLAYGDKDQCQPSPIHAALVHACKAPCFMGVRPDAKGPPGPLQAMSIEDGHHLYLNMIDPDRPLFRLAMFQHFLDYVDRHIQHRPVIVHCRAGLSRSPSLVLLWLAKRTAILPNSTYPEAANSFKTLWPYSPRAGIARWLHENWHQIPSISNNTRVQKAPPPMPGE